MLIGNVGKEPDVRYTNASTAMASFTLATDSSTYGKDGTLLSKNTEWHNILMWNRLAEIAERYIHKGDKLFIEGQIRYRSYTDKQGKTRFVTEIWAEKMEMLTPRTATVSPAEATAQPAKPAATDTGNNEGRPF